jgi:hypothetical protein
MLIAILPTPEGLSVADHRMLASLWRTSAPLLIVCVEREPLIHVLGLEGPLVPGEIEGAAGIRMSCAPQRLGPDTAWVMPKP